MKRLFVLAISMAFFVLVALNLAAVDDVNANYPVANNLTIFPPASDTYIASGPNWTTTPQGIANGLYVGYGDNLANERQMTRTLIHFNLASLGSVGSIRITDVKLRLYLTFSTFQYPGQTINLEVHPVTSLWNEADVTWSASPGYGAVWAESRVSPDTGRWIEWTLPSQEVEQWVNNPASNFGVALISPDGEQPGRHVRAFYSSNYQSGAYAPQLAIKYTVLPTPTPTPTVIPISTATPTPTPSGEWADWHVKPASNGASLPPLLLPTVGANAVLNYGNLTTGRPYIGTLSGAALFAAPQSNTVSGTLIAPSGAITFSLLPNGIPGSPFTLTVAIQPGPAISPREGLVTRAYYLPIMLQRSRYSSANHAGFSSVAETPRP